MVECPDPQCRESLIAATNSVCRDLRNDMNKKVSLKLMLSLLATIVTVGGLVAMLSYTAYSRGQDEKAEQIQQCNKVTKTLDKNVAVMQRDIEHIREQVEKQGQRQEKMIEILNELKRNSDNKHP